MVPISSSLGHFVTDADNREVLEYDGVSGAIQRWYAYGTGSNDVLGQTDVGPGTRTTLIPDIQGSFIASMASNATTFARAAFLPYGENSTNTTGTFRYTGSHMFIDNALNAKAFDDLIALADAREAPGVAMANAAVHERCI